MTGEPALIIRPMREEERREVHVLLGRPFPALMRMIITLSSLSPHVLVAEREGRLVGALVLKSFALPRGRRACLLEVLSTLPETRGLGVGRRLVEAAREQLAGVTCDEVFGCIEGYNTASSRLAASQGLTPLSPGEQFRRYGLHTFWVWLKTFHHVDLGHFLWASPPATRPDSPVLQWWGTLGLNLLLFWLFQWRVRDEWGPGWRELAGAVLAYLVFFGCRSFAMRRVAAWQGLKVRYRTWESAFLLSIGVALLGGLFTVPGSYYPLGHDWHYRALLPRLGRMALAGVLSTLLLAWGVWGLARNGLLPMGLEPLLTVGASLALLDIVAIFNPLTGFNGKRVWDWNRALWGVLAAAAVALAFQTLALDEGTCRKVECEPDEALVEDPAP